MPCQCLASSFSREKVATCAASEQFPCRGLAVQSPAGALWGVKPPKPPQGLQKSANASLRSLLGHSGRLAGEAGQPAKTASIGDLCRPFWPTQAIAWQRQVRATVGASPAAGVREHDRGGWAYPRTVNSLLIFNSQKHPLWGVVSPLLGFALFWTLILLLLAAAPAHYVVVL